MSVGLQYASLCHLASGFNLSGTAIKGWNCSLSSNICTGPVWTGVTCDLPGNIVSIDLTGIGIKGTIASNITGLTRLYYLALADNSLTGSIPSTLGALTALSTLDLANNLLQGSVPASLCNISSLTTFIPCNASSCADLSGCVPSCLASTVRISDYGNLGSCTNSPTVSPTTTAAPSAPTFTPTRQPSLSPSSFTVSSISTQRLPRDDIIIIGTVGGFFVLLCCIFVGYLVIFKSRFFNKNKVRVSSEGVVEKAGVGKVDHKLPPGDATTAAGNEEIRQAQGTSGQPGQGPKEGKEDGAGLVWKF